MSQDMSTCDNNALHKKKLLHETYELRKGVAPLNIKNNVTGDKHIRNNRNLNILTLKIRDLP